MRVCVYIPPKLHCFRKRAFASYGSALVVEEFSGSQCLWSMAPSLRLWLIVPGMHSCGRSAGCCSMWARTEQSATCGAQRTCFPCVLLHQIIKTESKPTPVKHVCSTTITAGALGQHVCHHIRLQRKQWCFSAVALTTKGGLRYCEKPESKVVCLWLEHSFTGNL